MYAIAGIGTTSDTPPLKTHWSCLLRDHKGPCLFDVGPTHWLYEIIKFLWGSLWSVMHKGVPWEDTIWELFHERFMSWWFKLYKKYFIMISVIESGTKYGYVAKAGLS